jgi:thiol:disulfide interchange protein DsbD
MERVGRGGGFLLAAFLSVSAAAGWAASAEGPHGKVELLAAQAAVQPGRPFQVGLHFQLEPGWHIYWINPGDSGEPPRVKWTLPAGYQAGPLLWPVPRRIEDHSLIDYGYQDQVLLPVKITPPAGQRGNANLQLSAAVSWLVCREMCLPGHAVLALTVPIQTGLPAPGNPLFIKTQAALPRPAPKSWRLTVKLDQHRFVLNVTTGKPETGATFFPLEANQIENAAPQKATPLPGGIQLEIQKSDQLLRAPANLSGVLVFASGQGYIIEAPVIASK